MAARRVRLAMWRAGHDLAQAGQALGVKERLALGGRAGNEHDELAMALEGGVKPLAGSGAVGVGENGCAGEQVGLLEVVAGHGDAPVAARAARAATWVPSRRSLMSRASATASRVRSSSVGPRPPMRTRMSMRRERGADGVDEVLSAVADDGFEGDGDADLVELLGEIEGVGVLAEGGEHLGADGDDFGFHKAAFSSQLSAGS